MKKSEKKRVYSGYIDILIQDEGMIDNNGTTGGKRNARWGGINSRPRCCL